MLKPRSRPTMSTESWSPSSGTVSGSTRPRCRICAPRYEKHVKNGGRPEVVVDLSGVGFAGSAALGNFVAMHRLARQRGGRLVLCNVDPTVREVLRASKLDALFEFAGDRADALGRQGAPRRAGGWRSQVESDPPRREAGDAPRPAPLDAVAIRNRRDGSGPAATDSGRAEKSKPRGATLSLSEPNSLQSTGHGLLSPER